MEKKFENKNKKKILSNLTRKKAKQKPRNGRLYASSVVMRIPAYNGDEEEPWYWAHYGRNLYEYSYYTDKYQKENDPDDYKKAQAAKRAVPDHIVNEFVWRRERNFNVTIQILADMDQDRVRKRKLIKESCTNSSNFLFCSKRTNFFDL